MDPDGCPPAAPGPRLPPPSSALLRNALRGLGPPDQTGRTRTAAASHGVPAPQSQRAGGRPPEQPRHPQQGGPPLDARDTRAPDPAREPRTSHQPLQHPQPQQQRTSRASPGSSVHPKVSHGAGIPQLRPQLQSFVPPAPQHARPPSSQPQPPQLAAVLEDGSNGAQPFSFEVFLQSVAVRQQQQRQEAPSAALLGRGGAPSPVSPPTSVLGAASGGLTGSAGLARTPPPQGGTQPQSQPQSQSGRPPPPRRNPTQPQPAAVVAAELAGPQDSPRQQAAAAAVLATGRSPPAAGSVGPVKGSAPGQGQGQVATAAMAAALRAAADVATGHHCTSQEHHHSQQRQVQMQRHLQEQQPQHPQQLRLNYTQDGGGRAASAGSAPASGRTAAVAAGPAAPGSAGAPLRGLLRPRLQGVAQAVAAAAAPVAPRTAAQHSHGQGPGSISVPLMVKHAPQHGRGGGSRGGGWCGGGSGGDDWPESRLLAVSDGVRIKGARLARMQDGILVTDTPGLFRVHSSSGQAEWWPVDMAAGLCACPNTSDVCSHIFGVCTAYPRYRIHMATLVKARDLVRWAAQKGAPPEAAVRTLAGCLGTWTREAAVAEEKRRARRGKAGGAAVAAGGGGGECEAEGYGESVEPCRVGAEVAVALLLQGVVEGEDVHGPGRRGGPRRGLWWQRAVQASGAPPPPQPLDPPPLSRQRLRDEVRCQLGALVSCLEQQATTGKGEDWRQAGPAVAAAAAPEVNARPKLALKVAGLDARMNSAEAKRADDDAVVRRDEKAGASSPSSPSSPSPRSVLGLLLELERNTCTALRLDSLTSGAAAAAAEGGNESCGGEGLLALLAESGPEMAELFERACGLALVMARQDPGGGVSREPRQEASAAGEASKPADEDGAGKQPVDTTAREGTQDQHQQLSPNQEQQQQEQLEDESGPEAGGMASGRACDAAEGQAGGAIAPRAAVSSPDSSSGSGLPDTRTTAADAIDEATGGVGVSSPLLEARLAAFCRQALAAATAASAAIPGGGDNDDTLRDQGGLDHQQTLLVAPWLEKLACQQFGAVQFADLVSHGSVSRLLQSAAAADGGAGDQQPLYALALLAGVERAGRVAAAGGSRDPMDGSVVIPLGPVSNGAGEDREGGEVVVGASGSKEQLLSAAMELLLQESVAVAVVGAAAEPGDPSRAPAGAQGSATAIATLLSHVSAAKAAVPGPGGLPSLSQSGAAAAAGLGLCGPMAVLALPGCLGTDGAQVMFVDSAATTRQFSEAVSSLDGTAAVAALLGMAAGAGALAALPLQLLAAVADDAAAKATMTASSAAGVGGCLRQRLGRYVLEVAVALPPPFLTCGPLLGLLLPQRLRVAIGTVDTAGGDRGPSKEEQRNAAATAEEEDEEAAEARREGTESAAAAGEGTMTPRSAAAAAAALAAALPGVLAVRAHVALWLLGCGLQLGGYSSSGSGLCQEAAAALRRNLQTAAARGVPCASASDSEAATGGTTTIAAAGTVANTAAGAAAADDDGGDDIVLVVPTRQGGRAGKAAAGRGQSGVAAVGTDGTNCGGDTSGGDPAASRRPLPVPDGSTRDGRQDGVEAVQAAAAAAAAATAALGISPGVAARGVAASGRPLRGVSDAAGRALALEAGAARPGMEVDGSGPGRGGAVAQAGGADVTATVPGPLASPLLSQASIPAWRLRGRVSPEQGRRVIESIRQQEFGVGVPAPPELAAVLATQSRRLQRALLRLAADLYASRVHLLLELAQNADDCSYPAELAAAGEEPTMALRVGPTGLAVATNERGFTEADVRALCDVGASSKAAAKQQGKQLLQGQEHLQEQQQQERRSQRAVGHGQLGFGAAVPSLVEVGHRPDSQGQTGEKGIGFKSVFAVSDAPAIYSNGFAFGFDAQDPTGLGYVLPQQLDPAADPTTPHHLHQHHHQNEFLPAATLTPPAAPPLPPPPPPSGWGTVILLPVAARLLAVPGATARGSPASAAPAAGDAMGAGGWTPGSLGPGTEAAAGAAVGAGSSGAGGRDSRRGNASWQSLARGLVGQVRPGVMLFLRRLRRLEVYDEVEGVRHCLTRRELAGGAVVQVTWRVEHLHGRTVAAEALPGVRETIHTWIVGSSTLAPPLVTRGMAGARPPYTTVQVALPLPPRRRRQEPQGDPQRGAVHGVLHRTTMSEYQEAPGPDYDGLDVDDAEDDAARDTGPCVGGGGASEGCWAAPCLPSFAPSCCQVYATLPLRPSGLPFDLQADWLVPSSREDISAGEAWNQMLRDQIPAAFLDAVRHSMRLVPSIRRGGWLRYVPYNEGAGSGLLLAAAGIARSAGVGSGDGAVRLGGVGGGGVAMPFLRPVVAAVAAALRSTPCILSYNADGGEGELLRPSQLVLGASQELRRLLPGPALTAATGLSYAITDGLALGVSRTLASSLGQDPDPDPGLDFEFLPACQGAAMAARNTNDVGHSKEGEDGEDGGGEGGHREGQQQQQEGDGEDFGLEEDAMAVVDAALLPPAAVVSALGLQVVDARLAMAALTVMLQSGTGSVGGGDDGSSRLGQAPALPKAAVSGAVAAEIAGTPGAGLLMSVPHWRWRLLAALEELFEEMEVQQSHQGRTPLRLSLRGAATASTSSGPRPGPGLLGGGAHGGPSLAALVAALRSLPLVPLGGGRVAPAAEALLPPGGGVSGNSLASVHVTDGGAAKGAAGSKSTAAARMPGDALASSCTAEEVVLLGEGGYEYGFERELPLVDVSGLASALRCRPAARERVHRCLARLGLGAPLQPVDVITRHVLPALARLRHEQQHHQRQYHNQGSLSQPQTQQQQQDQRQDQHLALEPRPEEGRSQLECAGAGGGAGGQAQLPCVIASQSQSESQPQPQPQPSAPHASPSSPAARALQPQTLVGYAAYLMHHQHLAARDPRVAAQWAAALVWVLVPPPPPTVPTPPPQLAGSRSSSGLSSGAPSQVDLTATVAESELKAEVVESAVHADGRDLGVEPPVGWALVPSCEGICLGLSFPELVAGVAGMVGTTGAAAAAAAGTAAARAALSALAAARQGVACALWSVAYLRYGSPAQWAQFCGPGVLGCGFTFVRVAQPVDIGLSRVPRPNTGFESRPGAVPGPAACSGSEDLEALLDSLGVTPLPRWSPGLPTSADSQSASGANVVAAPAGADSNNADLSAPGNSSTRLLPSETSSSQKAAPTAAVLPCLRAVAQLLDALWSTEYEKHAWMVDTADGFSTPTGTAHRRPSAFLTQLQDRAWMPDSWGSCEAPAGGGVLLPSRALRGLLGPQAKYVGPELTDPRFCSALGLPSAPSLQCVLDQLRRWRELAAAGDNEDAETTRATGHESQRRGHRGNGNGTSAEAVEAGVEGGLRPPPPLASRRQMVPQPAVPHLTRCYSYLWGLLAEEASAAPAATVTPEEELHSHGEHGVSSNSGRAPDGCGGGGVVLAQLSSAFAATPLIAVPCVPMSAVTASPGRQASEVGGGVSGSALLSWFRPQQVVWSLGPLAEATAVGLGLGGPTLAGGNRRGDPSGAMTAASAAIALLPAQLAATYPASLKALFVGALGVGPHPTTHHLLAACRQQAVAAAADPGPPCRPTAAATALTCLGWLGWLVGLSQPSAQKRDGQGGSAGGTGTGRDNSDSELSNTGLELASTRGHHGQLEAAAPGLASVALPSLLQEEEEELHEVLLRQALLPTVDGRWVAAPRRPRQWAEAAEEVLEKREEEPEAPERRRLVVVMDDMAAAAKTTGGIGGGTSSAWRLRDAAIAVPELLRAATAAGVQLDIIGLPSLLSDASGSPAAAAAPITAADGVGGRGPIPSGWCAAGLQFLLYGMLELSTLGSVVDVDVELGMDLGSALDSDGLAPASGWDGATSSYLRPEAHEEEQLRRSGTELAAVGAGAGAYARLAVAPSGAGLSTRHLLTVQPESSVERQQQWCQQDIERLARNAQRVMDRLNDLAPFLERWLAAHGVSSGDDADSSREAVVLPATYPKAQPPEQADMGGDGMGRDNDDWGGPAAADGDNSEIWRWARLAAGLQVAAVDGGVGVVHVLSTLHLRTKPRPVAAAMLLRGPGGPSRDAEGKTGAEAELGYSAAGGPVLYVSCTNRSGGAAQGPDSEGWRVVFGEVSRLLGCGRPDPECGRFLLLLHTLLEAGQSSDVLEATVTALYGNLPPPPLPPSSSSADGAARATEEAGVRRGLRFGAAWEVPPPPQPGPLLPPTALPGAVDAGRGDARCGGDDGATAGGYGLSDVGEVEVDESGAAAWTGEAETVHEGEDVGGEERRKSRRNGVRVEGGTAVGEAADPRSLDSDGGHGAHGTGGDILDGDGGGGGGKRELLRRPQPAAGLLGTAEEGGMAGGAEESAGVQGSEGSEGDPAAATAHARDGHRGGTGTLAGPDPRVSHFAEERAPQAHLQHQPAHMSAARPAGLGSLAQSLAPSAAYQQEALDIGVEMHRSLAGDLTPLQLPVAPEDVPRAAREAVGRWGEEYVAAYLRVKAGPGEVVEWINARDEQCRPYDLLIRREDTGEVVAFVEVKATSSWDKTYFEVSHREWLFAQQEGARYHIYRIFGAGQQQHAQQPQLPRVVRIVNPYLQWRSQRVGICLVL